MAELVNTPAYDLGKLKQIEALADDAARSAYHTEMDAIDRETKRLDNGPSNEEEWDQWEERTIRIWGEIEALPPTPENTQLKAHAVWTIINGDVENINVGDSTCCRLVRQIVTGLAEYRNGERARWDAALAGLRRAKVAHLAAVDDHGEAEARYYAAHPGTSQSELEALIAKTQSNDARTSGERSAAADAVLACPAPDLAAVARKIEIAQEYGREASELAPVIADLRRLGGEA